MLRLVIIRKKRMYTIIVAVIILFIFGMSLIRLRSDYVETIIIPENTRVIIIDPGHGGIDPGAVGKAGTLEKDINLSISLFLKGYLEKNGEIVILTRKTDEGSRLSHEELF